MDEIYTTVCCICKKEFQTPLMPVQKLGYWDMGCVRCPYCKELLNLDFDNKSKKMTTEKWDKVSWTRVKNCK